MSTRRSVQRGVHRWRRATITPQAAPARISATDPVTPHGFPVWPPYPLGANALTYRTDGCGKTAHRHTVMTVVDTTPPASSAPPAQELRVRRPRRDAGDRAMATTATSARHRRLSAPQAGFSCSHLPH